MNVYRHPKGEGFGRIMRSHFLDETCSKALIEQTQLTEMWEACYMISALLFKLRNIYEEAFAHR